VTGWFGRFGGSGIGIGIRSLMRIWISIGTQIFLPNWSLRYLCCDIHNIDFASASLTEAGIV
jgi:hypothetical protein